MNDPEKPVRRALDAYQAAVLAKDADAFMQLYDADVRVFDTWGVWSYEGAAAWRVAVEGWFSSLGRETVRVAFDDVTITADAHMATVTGFARYAALSPDGQELRAMHNRFTWVLRLRGHVLRVVHEHSSTPIGFEDTKALFQRDAKA